MTDELHVPDDAGEHAAALAAILRRIPKEWGQRLSVDRGWYSLIVEVDQQLAEIDPGYELHQCKEKFGELRFYAHTSVAGNEEAFRAVIAAAEARAAIICEMCGTAGRLRQSQCGRLVTACDSCAAGLGAEPCNE